MLQGMVAVSKHSRHNWDGPQTVNITAQYFCLEVILCIMFPLNDSILLSNIKDVACVAITL